MVLLQLFSHSASTVILAVLVAVYAQHIIRRRTSSLPPGPLGFPFIGTLVELTALNRAEEVTKWTQKYGDLIYLHAFGESIVVLNSAKAAFDLLDRRGSLYSDRPQQAMACDLCGMGRIVVLTPIGERFKRERKLMSIVLNPRVISKWEPIMADETRALLLRLLQQPDRFKQHLRGYAAGVIFRTVYGYKIKGSDDPLVKNAEEFMDISGIAITGVWLVNFFSFLRWIPGLAFQRTAALWRSKIPDWVDKPHEQLRECIAASPESFCGTLLHPPDGSIVDAETEDAVKWIATSLYAAGSDTAVATLGSFIRAMVLHPEVQKMAAKEIDAVVGRDRLPDFNDRPQLPFIECLYKELLRWSTVVAFAVPHRLTQDDEYKGRILPQGSLCLANIWAMLHDETLFPNSHAFLPSRYETPVDPETEKMMDPETYLFGFGRRRCPGVHFVHQSVWVGMVNILACFKISPAKDCDGNPILPDLKVMEGPLRHPAPFPCCITPRHERISELIG